MTVSIQVSAIASSAGNLITVCRSCAGSDALLSDIEELCAQVQNLGAPVIGGCLNHCSEGPNCAIDSQVLYRNRTFEKSLEVVRHSLGGSEPLVPDDVLRRIQLKSDAMRSMECGPDQNMAKAEELLTVAIHLELESPSADCKVHRRWLCDLRSLRARVRASAALGDFDGALSDLGDILVEQPESAHTFLEKAKLLRRAKRPNDALNCLTKALELGEKLSISEDGLDSKSFSPQECTWIRSSIESLKDVIALGDAAEGNSSAEDSGDGSGRWKVVKITGMSVDTCIYHLENSPPAEPHPYPKDAWHISVRFGAASRDYTPISNALDWERGRLDLLVKTYVDGEVTRKFATLQPFKVSQGSCWVPMVTVPKLTLTLPNLQEGMQLQSGCRQDSSLPTGRPETSQIGIVVGGTGVVPALQILREVAKGIDGAFGSVCKAVLVYASRRACDVLALDELRAVEASAPGRIVVWHTLTDHREDSGARDLEAQDASTRFSQGLSSLPCRHRFFTSFWKPFVTESVPLRTGLGEEAGLRGRPTAAMLGALLPKPGEGVRTLVSGPPQMWDDVREMLFSLGHLDASLVELKSLSAEQIAGGACSGDSKLAGEKFVVKPPSPKQGGEFADVEERIQAAHAVAVNDDALRRKSASAVAQVAVQAKVSTVATTAIGSDKSPCWQDAWWKGTGGWSADAWRNSEDRAWKTAKWN